MTPPSERARVDIVLSDIAYQCLRKYTATSAPAYAVLEEAESLSGSGQWGVRCDDAQAMILLGVAEAACQAAVPDIREAIDTATCPQCGKPVVKRHVGRSGFGAPGAAAQRVLRPAECEHCGWEEPKS